MLLTNPIMYRIKVPEYIMIPNLPLKSLNSFLILINNRIFNFLVSHLFHELIMQYFLAPFGYSINDFKAYNEKESDTYYDENGQEKHIHGILVKQSLMIAFNVFEQAFGFFKVCNDFEHDTYLALEGFVEFSFWINLQSIYYLSEARELCPKCLFWIKFKITARVKILFFIR